MKLEIYDRLPHRFLEVKPDGLEDILAGPSLIRLAGKKEPPLFVATLLHGNEPTGFLALQKLLRKYQDDNPLPRSLIIFIGNVFAAKKNIRHLRRQPDFNRIWNGGDQPEQKMARQVIEFAKDSKVMACVDIHNNSGKNPHYSIVNRLDPTFINLARLFSKTMAYFTRPVEVLSQAFSEFCPSVTIESGQLGDPYGVEHVLEYLDKCLRLDRVPVDKGAAGDGVELYHSAACIKVPHKSRVGFDRNFRDKDFCFIENLDGLNFTRLPENTLLGWRFNPELDLRVMDEKGQNVRERYIRYDEEEIRLTRPVIPSMFTTDEELVYQDCLGYLMEPCTLL